MTEKKQTLDFKHGHHKWVIVAMVDECHVDYSVYEEVGSYDGQPVYGETGSLLDDAKPDFRGFVKWDACSNWDFQPRDVMVHFCGKETIDAWHALLLFLQNKAKELIPRADPEMFA